MLRRILPIHISKFETLICSLKLKIDELEERIKRLEKNDDSLQTDAQVPLCESLDCVDDFNRIVDFDLLEPR